MSVEMKIPSVGESVTEATIGTWYKSDGDYVERDEALCELESDKASMDLAAVEAGIVRIVVEEGETVDVGTVICKIEEGDAPAGSAPAEEKTEAAPKIESSSPGGGTSTYAAGHASPSAKKILDEKGVSSSDIQGSGRDGRITKEDALKADAAKKPAPQQAAEAPKAKAAAGARDTEIKRMSSMRKTIAKRLVQVKNETAMLTTFNEVDLTAIKEIRIKYQDSFVKRYNIKLGFMSFFVKACSTALMEFPNVNAMIDDTNLVYHNYVDMSIAVSTEKGLVTPVIRNAEQLTFAEVEQTIIDYSKKARDGKITIPDMTGGTFTITNGGIFGSMMSTPIINPPQSAILGMHNIVERPIAVNNQVLIRPMMYIALSYDHRVIDGKDSVSFLVRVKQLLEDPSRLLIEA